MKRYLPFILVPIAFSVLFLLGLTCPIRYATGIPCPCCGMTRALISLCKLDFASYWRYNAMALLVVSDIILIFFEKRIRHKKIFYAYLIGTLLLNLVYYAYRVRFGRIL